MSRKHRNKYQKAQQEEKLALTPKASAERWQQQSHSAIPIIQQLCPRWQYTEADDKEGVGYYLCNPYDGGPSGRTITPDEAEAICNQHNYKGQRRFDYRWAEHLANNIHTILNVSFAIGPNNCPWLVNGQHSLWAIFLRQIPVCCQISIYQCRDEKAIGDVYALFDNGRGRTSTQILDAAGIDSGIPNMDLNRWARAVEIARNNFQKPSRTTNSEKLEFARDLIVQDFAKWAHEIINKYVNAKNRLWLTPQGVQAGMFAMWSSDRPAAEEFLRMYLTGIDLGEGNPILAFREKMNTREGEHNAVEMNEHCRRLFSAWDKWCKGVKVTVQHFRATKEGRLPKYDAWKINLRPAPTPVETAVPPTEDEVSTAKGKIGLLGIPIGRESTAKIGG